MTNIGKVASSTGFARSACAEPRPPLPPIAFRRLHLAGCFHRLPPCLRELSASCSSRRRPGPARPATRCCPRRRRATLSVAQAEGIRRALGQDAARPDVERRHDASRSSRTSASSCSDDFGAVERKLGLRADDLNGVTGGRAEPCRSSSAKGQEAALAITMDVTGHEKKADEFAGGRREAVQPNGSGKKTTSQSGRHDVASFHVPAVKPGKTQQTIYFIKDNVLVGVDDRGRGRSDSQAVCRQRDGQLEIGDGLHGRRWSAAAKKQAAWSPRRAGLSSRSALIFAERTLQEQAAAERTRTWRRSLRQRLRRRSKARAVT